MTRKDFELIAEVLKDNLQHAINGGNVKYEAYTRTVTEDVANLFAIRLREQNPRFKKERFLRACGIDNV